MAKNYSWALTDSDCYQHIRCVNGVYELVQFVWLDTTEQEKNDGLYEYCIVNATCNLNDYSEKDIEIYISSYGYTHESLIKEYGEDGANDLIAECILEEICLRDECIMYECNTKEECVEYINNFMNLEEK